MPQPPSPAGRGVSPYAASDVTSRMRPSPRSSMPGRNVFASSSGARTFAWSCRSSSSSGVSRKRSMWPGPMYRPFCTTTSTRPQRSSTVVAAPASEARSKRSAGSASARTPVASISATVVARLPGSGFVFEARSVEECSRSSPSFTVRAVTATSKPARARWSAHAFPMPRLAPVTNATLPMSRPPAAHGRRILDEGAAPAVDPAAMRVVIEPEDEVYRLAALRIALSVRAQPRCVLGLATGRTMAPLYAELVRLHRAEGLSFAGVTAFNLDEYVGSAKGAPGSFRRFMQEHLAAHVDLPARALHLPDGASPDPAAAARAYEAEIRAAGGIDLQLLGLGVNAHLGFNEPGSSLASRTRVKTLSDETLAANHGELPAGVREQRLAITLGLGTILE